MRTPISNNIEEIDQVGDLEINMVEPVAAEVPNPEDLVIAEDLQLDLKPTHSPTVLSEKNRRSPPCDLWIAHAA